MSECFSLAFGIGTQNNAGNWLEVYYPQPLLNPDAALIKVISEQLGYDGGNQAIELAAGQCEALGKALSAAGFGDAAALIGSLQGGSRPLDINELPQRQLAARLQGQALNVLSVDKFPSMTDYVVPSGVRIANTARVRLGAYVGEGTTVMHEGFINFNAGTAGTSMVEGRISAGVFVGKGSDLGGGCSTMGTLSGGGNIVISIGEGCLIGANAGIGIPLGDRCTIEAGLYITAGIKVALLDDADNLVEVVKARDLANQHDLLFRRNSQTGSIECKTNKSAIQLNEILHAHN